MKTKKIVEGEYIIIGGGANRHGDNVYRIDRVNGRWAVISRNHFHKNHKCCVEKDDTLASFMRRCESVFEDSKKGQRVYRVIDLSSGMVSDRAIASIGANEFLTANEFLFDHCQYIEDLRAPSEDVDSEILTLQTEIALDYDLDASYLNKIGESNLDKAVEELNETEL